MDHGEHQIDQITSPAAFLAALRALKERSGLTYRQLEQRASAHGNVLARSTIADVLRRDTLPRPEVLAAFVRACGQGDLVAAWLRARDRLATAALVPCAPSTPPTTPAGAGTAPSAAAESAAPSGAPPATVPADASGPPGEGRGGRGVPALLAIGAVALAAAGVWLAGLDRAPAGPAAPQVQPAATASAPGPIAGRVRVRPARTPLLCLSEGRDSTRAYSAEIAVQRSCAGSTPPETYLEAAGDGLHFIKWVHPVKGPGCLTVRGDNPGMFLLEPWVDCRPERQTQVFRFETLPGEPGAYRIRSGREGLCVGIRNDATDATAAALAEPCTTGRDQAFLVDELA